MRARQKSKVLDLNDLDANPLREFENWFQLATQSGEKNPDAMTLATCSLKGVPSSRTVLYKGLLKGSFKVFTNYQSRKGKELIENPRAALTFYWKALNRQVRVEGRVTRMPKSTAESYFHSRPRLSQLGAWASKQSSIIPNRAYLMGRLKHYEMMFHGTTIPLPEHWGGFLLKPERLEFWIEGDFRLHDRFEYVKKGGRWKRVRLSP